MEWTDTGVVVGLKRHGEAGVILDVLTRRHGRHLGFVHGGRSRRLRAALQPGNSLDLAWRSRVEEGLGGFTVEPARQRAARIMASGAALHAVQYLCTLVRFLAEREPHELLHDRMVDLLEAIDDPATTPLAMVRFELAVLRDLGFGLDLARCAATGQAHDLCFVSPRTGRAVSREAGWPYRDRMLALPPFVLAGDGGRAEEHELRAGFRLAAHFLERDVFAPRGLPLPDARGAYLRTLETP